MIDLTLYPKIQQDIQSRNTSLIPLIVIDEEHDPIYISTQKGLFDGDKFFEDIGLKISSIKENIDIKRKNFQINNVSFELNNYPKNGTRLSDLISSMGLVNKRIKVYYKTQSCSILSDCMKLYDGKIKRLSHDETKIKFQLEDFTQTYLSKTVPISNIGNYNYAYNKDYIGRPIPITYGEVDKAPAIPWVNKISVDNDVNIKVICDDVLDPDRNIEVGGFGDFSQEFLSPLARGGSNPLYIYKGDYFQVLEEFNPDVLGEDHDDWFWENNNQYSVNNNWIEIRKHYSGAIPKNPPAYNEFQCIKVRFPNQCLIMGNPEGDSITDDNNVGIIHQQVSVKSPELAIDNPISLPLSSFYNLDHQSSDSYFDTRAEVPDNTVDVDVDELIVSDFRAHPNDGSNAGIWMPRESSSVYPHKLFEWLNINMHNLNADLDNPRVVYKQLPQIGKIVSQINYRLAGDVNNGINYIEDTSTTGVTFMVENKDYYKSNFHQDGLDAPDNYFDEPSQLNSSFLSQTEGLQWYYDLNPNSPVPQGITLGFMVKNAYRKPIEDGGVGCDFVYVGMENGSFSVSDLESISYNPNMPWGNNSFGSSKYFSLFNIGNSSPWLFDESLFAEYAPISVSQKGFFMENKPNTYFTSYRCNWNGIASGANTGNNWDLRLNSLNYWLGYGNYQAIIKNRNLLYNDENNWVIWVKGESFGNVGIQYDDQDVNPMTEGAEGFTCPQGINENLRMTTNSMFPTMHRNAEVSGQYGGYTEVRVDFHGYQENLYPDAFTVSDYDTANNIADKRVGLVFPLGDLDVSDDLKADTFFHGKIDCRFKTENGETTDSANASFKLNIGTVDTTALDNEGNLELNFDTLDDGFDQDGNLISSLLIDKTLEECNTLNEQMWSSNPSDIPVYDDNDNIIENESNVNFNEQGEGLVKINQFWNINNYNAFALIYRLDNNNIGTEASNASSGAEAALYSNVYSAGLLHYIIFEKALDSNLYANSIGRVNNPDDYIDNQNGTFYKYTGEVHDPDSVSHIDNPTDIIFHFIEKELGLAEYADLDNISLARSVHAEDSYGFSVKEEIEAKQLIQEFASNTRIFPKFKSSSEFSYAYIKSTYSEGDEDFIIKSKDVIKYSFRRTPIEDIYTIVNVKYKKDYETDDLLKETGYVDGYDIYGNGDGTDTQEGRANGYSYDYLGLKREDNIHEFESSFIRNENTALALRNFIYMNNCNQHNLFKLTLPIKYLMLEAGDVVRFDSLVNNMKAYGEDYTKIQSRNGQNITPLFMVKSINKKSTSIDIECYQLHELVWSFNCAMGSTTRMIDTEEFAQLRTLEDWSLLDGFLNNGEKYYTREQKRVSDILQDGAIDDSDLDVLQDMTEIFISQLAGDVNADGVVNVSDIIGVISSILGTQELPEELVEFADVNQDGVVNVIDIIAMVNQILGE